MAASNFRVPRLKDIILARRIVSKYLKPTPLFYSRGLSDLLSCEAYVKLENLQPTMSFKVRGGVYYMSKMSEEAVRRGVITASTGNHAQSIAYAGALFGADVKVVMPEGVPQLKVESTRALGAEVIKYGGFFDQSREYAEKQAADKGYLFVHSINEPLLIEGVGSMHLEVLDELPDVEVVVNPIGGGSGASSACIVYKGIDPSIRVIGVQAEGSPAVYQSWKTGRLVTLQAINTEAEGLATAAAYELPMQILSRYLNDIVLVSDVEMKNAVRTLYQNIRQVAELAGAASTAAAMKIKENLADKKVVLMLTGGNIQSEVLSRLL